MLSLLLLAGVAFLTALITTPLFRYLALRCGRVDRPDGKRKAHSRAVPRIGGVGILLAYVGAFGALLWLDLPAAGVIREAMPQILGVAPAALLVFLIGLWDDLFGLSPCRKLVAQLACATYVTLSGIQMASVGAHPLPAWLGVPLSIMWLVGATNAFNLIDGLDGLAGSVGFFASLTVFIAAVTIRDVGLALATLPLAGALVGFLRYNFEPASVFMGDCGSLFVGFLLGCFSLVWGAKSATVLGISAPLIVLAFPLTDTALAIVRRKLRGFSIFHADRGHIHHKLLDRGLSPRQITDLICVLCTLLAALALLTSITQRIALAVVATVLGGVGMAIHHLRYTELEAVRRVFLRNIWRNVSSEIDVVQLEETLAKATSLESCLAAVESACQPLGICVSCGGESDTPVIRWDTQESAQWELYVRISKRTCISFHSDTQNRTEFRVSGGLIETAIWGIHRFVPKTQRSFGGEGPVTEKSFVAVAGAPRD